MDVRHCKEIGISLQKIIKRLLANQNLCKLLYYTGKDPLNEPIIENTSVLYDNIIKVVPRLPPEETAHSYVVPLIINGITDSVNTEFKNFLIRVYVYVPMEQWPIKDENLRPFAIMHEIYECLDGKNVNGLGKLKGGDFSLNLLTDSMTCYTIEFTVTNYD